MTELPPPVLTETGSYEAWRSEIQMWQITTTMEPKRQALFVRAKLSGKAREVALKLDAADLNNDDGMTFLIDELDANFRKKPKKWDVLVSSASNSKDNGVIVVKDEKPPIENPSTSPSLTATDKAKQRAAELNDKLKAEGKALPPGSLPEQQSKVIAPLITAASQLGQQANQYALPEVKKMNNGNSFAEFVINDVSARPFLTRLSTRDLIAEKSGTSVSLRGRFLSEKDKVWQSSGNGAGEKPLCLCIQANVAAKVQVALHKIAEVCRAYDAVGPENNYNNYGLTADITPNNHHFVQRKLWVGMEHVHPDFELNVKLAGENGTNFAFMVQQTGAKVFLRGKGSGYMEPNSGRESFEALHIYISHPRQDGLDMAHQLCESLIETVKAQYEEWNAQRITQPPNISYRPPCIEENEVPYSTYPPSTNGYDAPYGSIPSLMNTRISPPPHVTASSSSHVPQNSRQITPLADYREAQTPVVDYRQTYTRETVAEQRPPRGSQLYSSVEERHHPESEFRGDDRLSSGKSNYDNKHEQEQPRDHNTNEYNRIEDTNNQERKHDRSSRRSSRSGENQRDSDTKTSVRSHSPEKRKPRFRESKSKSKEEPSSNKESPSNKESSPARRHSPPLRRTSPNRRDSPPRQNSPERIDLSGRRDSPPRRRDAHTRSRGSRSGRGDASPPHRNSSPVQRESFRQESHVTRWDETPAKQDSLPIRIDSPPHGRNSPSYLRESHIRIDSPPCADSKTSPPRERTKRKFTEAAPKKRRKFSEDPRLIEEAKARAARAAMIVKDVGPKEPEKDTDTFTSLESLNEKHGPPKLQFRSKKESSENKPKPILKPKSILKMAPPTNLPIPPKRNGISKSVKISPSGILKKATFTEKSMEKDDAIFKPPPPIETLKPPQAPSPKVLQMGALSSLSMYADDDSDDD